MTDIIASPAVKEAVKVVMEQLFDILAPYSGKAGL